MNPEYTWLALGKGSKNFIDIMGAPIVDPSVFLREIQRVMRMGQITLCIGGELKTSSEGKPASNFRYEKDEIINKNVIENYLQLFNLHREIYRSKPIFVTTIPRSWRLYSWLITDDGKIIRKDQGYRRRADDENDPISYHGFPSGEDEYDKLDEDLTLFLSYNCIESEHLIKIRECCKGARYHTYLADMISFLYQLRCNQDEFSDTFYPEYREAVSRSNRDSMDTLSFEKSMDNGMVFLCPKRESVVSIYQDFEDAISLKENPIKAKIREHLKKNKIQRWTDFSANDTDDAFTILMMIHAFNGLVDETNEQGYSRSIIYSLSQEDKIILDGLHSSLDKWHSQLQ